MGAQDQQAIGRAVASESQGMGRYRAKALLHDFHPGRCRAGPLDHPAEGRIARQLLIIWLLQRSTRCCAKTESAPLELAVCLSNQIIRRQLVENDGSSHYGGVISRTGTGEVPNAGLELTVVVSPLPQPATFNTYTLSSPLAAMF